MMKPMATRVLEFYTQDDDFVFGLQKLIQLSLGKFLRIIEKEPSKMVFEVSKNKEKTEIIGKLYIEDNKVSYSKFLNNQFQEKLPSPRVQGIVDVWVKRSLKV